MLSMNSPRLAGIPRPLCSRLRSMMATDGALDNSAAESLRAGAYRQAGPIHGALSARGLHTGGRPIVTLVRTPVPRGTRARRASEGRARDATPGLVRRARVAWVFAHVPSPRWRVGLVNGSSCP